MERIREADFTNMPQPLKDAFLRVNPDERQLRTMHDKDAARMRSFEDVPDCPKPSMPRDDLVYLQDILEAIRSAAPPPRRSSLARLRRGGGRGRSRRRRG